MNTYGSIKDIPSKYLMDIQQDMNDELIDLLHLLENVNSCNQEYDVLGESMVISYILRINLFSFFKRGFFNIKTRVVGLPISLCYKGYFGNEEEIKEILKGKSGLTLILNGDGELKEKGQTLSMLIFYNRFKSFEQYVQAMRYGYRRRIRKALSHREDLIINRISPSEFSETHHRLYKSVVKRSEYPLETLDIRFFQEYKAEIYEFLDRDDERILGFIQLKRIDDTLIFMFCGFEQDDNDKHDLYYNMLLKIVEIGIETGVGRINFGQTSEESKMKIGCISQPKYLDIYHGNRLVNWMIQRLVPIFSYRSTNQIYRVFKEELQ